MGTSSAYKGSSSRVSTKLREDIEEWVDSQDGETKKPISPDVVAQALNIPSFSRRGSRSGFGGAGTNESEPKKQSHPRREASGYISTVSRAAGLARALREGDRETIEKAGLDFDKLSGLASDAEVVRAILDVVCESQSDSDIPAEEQREIAGKLLEWILDTDENPEIPDTEAIAENAISTMIAEIFLTEAGEFNSTSTVTREEFVNDVYDAGRQLAARANLSGKSIKAGDINKVISEGLQSLRRIYMHKTK